MTNNDTGCSKCGNNPFQAAKRGAYLKRINKFGVTGIWECRPGCNDGHGNQDSALLAALDDNENED